MEINEIFKAYLNVLYNQWLFDVKVFSTNMWMYALLCIPAIMYFLFCIFKWWFLLIPITLPLSIISSIGRKTVDLSKNKNNVELNESEDKE
jgi:hypothetical protein